jgi:hypothetical protein
MKKIATLFLLAFLIIPGSYCFAQEMDTYEAKSFNLKFDIPQGWETKIDQDEDVPSLEADSPDGSISLMVLIYKDASILPEDLFKSTTESLALEIDGEYHQEETNDMPAFIGQGSAVIADMKVGIVLMTATYEENNYVIYIFTEYSSFNSNVEIMNKILDSFAPLDDE